ncbi:hypothetical protein NKT77_00770 [Moraxella sp. FZLJ2107]|uniref:hypothetical protein n=1 Tax=unclassified Moraxella TaxID=2685852 RepID=UPI00209C0EA8|nr:MULTISPECIES: hypothetical protein [unclassified Moraxella]USZ14556.1 hypothetical protein NGM44_09340 [Moraxella sp. FZFQ2102]UTO05226.1 hypothetical protein NKT77_00770 [Moraxella sp. FZLJ2107]UTO21961.1 hypothetical protein NKU06_09070 [Moraxella sp. FZLJ2109]
MKKSFGAAILAVAALTGCAAGGTTGAATAGDATAIGVGTATNVGMAIFQQAVDAKCRTELNNQPIYKTASMVLSSEQKTALENNVCGCVAEKAPQSVTITEIAQAAVSPAARTQVVASAVTKTINACATSFLGQ